jgi:hypothetical protein
MESGHRLLTLLYTIFGGPETLRPNLLGPDPRNHGSTGVCWILLIWPAWIGSERSVVFLAESRRKAGIRKGIRPRVRAVPILWGKGKHPEDS